MNERPELQHNGHWRMAVWALRVGYVGLAVAIAGLIVESLGSTPWAWVLVDAVHAHPRHSRRKDVDPAVLTAPSFADPPVAGTGPASAGRRTADSAWLPSI